MEMSSHRRIRVNHSLCFVIIWILATSVSCETSLDCQPCVCTPLGSGSQAMDCMNKSLDGIPEFLNNGNYTNVTRLYLSYNNITTVEEGALDGLPNLNALFLSYNNISSIEDQAFYQIGLDILDLSNNQLTNGSFNETAFEELEADTLDLSRNFLSEPPRAPNTRFYILHHNPFKVLKEDAFAGFPSSKITSIDVSDCELEDIERGVFNKTKFFDLTEVFLDNNKLRTLKPSFFANAAIIEKLSIQNSGVERIEEGTFSDLRNIKYLYLSKNNLGNPLDRRSFINLSVVNLYLKECNITRLKRNFLNIKISNILDLSSNNISTIFENAFGGLKKVLKLFLKNCGISLIKDQPFKRLTRLQELYLDFNQLDDESHDFLGPHTELRILDISQNKFQKLPNITGCTSLFDLYGHSNELNKIESGSFDGIDIRNLRLSSNHNLSHIDEDALLPINNLTDLDLSWSSLKMLPALNHSKLLTINLINAQIDQLPSDLCIRAPKLFQISVTDNNLTAIPDLQNCSQLSMLHFDSNKIKKIGKNTFKGLDNLLTLYLHGNEIEEIHPNAFVGLKTLAFLHLSHNKIPFLPPSLLDGLNQLDTLTLQYNKITNLPQDIFKDLDSLRILYINDNSINDVGQTIFPSNLTWLQELNVSNNPQMSKFPIPQDGFPFIHTFSMQNVPLIYNVPSISKIPRIQYIQLTYPYHCCVYRNHLPSDLLNTPRKKKPVTTDTTPTVYDPTIHGNGTHVNLTIEHESDEIVFIVIRPSQEPLTLPPEILENLLFPELQDPYNPRNHDITQEEFDRVIQKIAHHDNLTIRLLPNNEIDVVGFNDNELTVYGGLTKDTITKIFSELPVFNNLSQVSCEPAPNAFMPCENLLDPDPIRVLVWILWFPTVLGNIAVIFVLLASTEKVDVPNFILCNLALADFLLGIYLSFLGVVDVKTFGDGSFYKSALHWQRGPGCQTAGFIAVFSTELSVYLMVVLTLERLQTIAYSFDQQGSRMRMRHAIVLVCIGWVVAGVAALLPLFDINSYSEVAICLPFRTEYIRDKAFIGVLLLLTVAAFLIILFSYIHILVIYCKSPACERRTQERFTTSIKMGVLVFTNSICWLPFTVLGLASLADVYLVNLTVAKYFIVLILPLNSCLNPFLYTISKKKFWQKFRSIFKRTEQRLQEVTPNNHRRNSLASASTTSSYQDTIDFDLLQKRRSRRSFSLQMETVPTIASTSQYVSLVPYTGRRYSSPAIFDVDNKCRRVGTRMASDPTLVEQPETRFTSHSGVRPQSEPFNRNSNCLSVVHEETSMYGSDDEDDAMYPQSPFRFSAEFKAHQKANADRSSSSQHQHRPNVTDYIRRGIHVVHEECDNRSDCSSSSEYDDARSSPLPPPSQCTTNTVNTEGCNELKSSTTDNYLVTPMNTKQNMLTRIINPHTKRPRKGAVESSC